MEHIVVYLTESGDLYYDSFYTKKAAMEFIENTDDKCIYIEGKKMETEDYT